ncbi:hypothetical protein Sros_5676 [Streptosporangium roseum DSM 43021]|uniref:Uncharacterized protein n=1 Tax=Streptosporangium roseum (strain ATCC 12428 / DSM 43021 / JCM 3005 / KCTC 9067 / NCIMB 10171 / NRRL 2505 / NI 9100) TaxID=479432 RepID=D2AR84_STRRD|nr:hypothetical protein Sros_5676 [Streptosporangium roseum DSM 43021]
MKVTVVEHATDTEHVSAWEGSAVIAVAITRLNTPVSVIPRRLFDTAASPRSPAPVRG